MFIRSNDAHTPLGPYPSALLSRLAPHAPYCTPPLRARAHSARVKHGMRTPPHAAPLD